jgi:hypothetical protein
MLSINRNTYKKKPTNPNIMSLAQIAGHSCPIFPSHTMRKRTRPSPTTHLPHQQPLNRIRILHKRASCRRRRKPHINQLIRRRLTRRRETQHIKARPRHAAIPIRGIITKAFPHRDGAVTSRPQALDLILSQGVDGLTVDVVIEDDVAG